MLDAVARTVSDLRGAILGRVKACRDDVWTPSDFVDLGGRDAVDKMLQRLVMAGELRRIDRGLYDLPSHNNLTGKPSVPDYRAVIRAIARRDQIRFVVDGMTAANDLGLTTAVPARIEVMVDARLKPIRLGAQETASRRRPRAASTGLAVQPCVSSRRCTGFRMCCSVRRNEPASWMSCDASLPIRRMVRCLPRISVWVSPPCRSGCRNCCGR